MSVRGRLSRARQLLAAGEYVEGRKILERIATDDPKTRTDVLLALLTVLDHLTENDKLMEVANEGIAITIRTGNHGALGYFRGNKANFLLATLSMMAYRQKNLTLSASVFEWIGFSLERDKQEHEQIVEERKEVETEAESLIETVKQSAEHGGDHYFKGHLFSCIADYYSSKYLIDQLDLYEGGRRKSWIANRYFVRRWNLDKLLFSSESRRKILYSRSECVRYYEKAISEFQLSGHKSEEAYMAYNLAAKYKLFYKFRKAKALLKKARAAATELNDVALLRKIEGLEHDTEDKNRNPRDYVNEFGLDLP